MLRLIATEAKQPQKVSVQVMGSSSSGAVTVEHVGVRLCVVEKASGCVISHCGHPFIGAPPRVPPAAVEFLPLLSMAPF